MRIAINAMFWQQATVGSGQYLRGLVRALASHPAQPQLTLILPPCHSSPSDVPAHVECVTAALPSWLKAGFAKLYFEQIALPQIAARLGADVLHVPYFAAPLRSPLPTVVTILDLIPLRLPAYRGRAQVRAYMHLVAQAARRATQVLTISEHAAREIRVHLHIPAERIHVTPLAAGALFQPMDRDRARAEVAKRYGIRTPFVYYVGGLDLRKNVPMLIRAFAGMRCAGGPEVTLVIAGQALSNNPQLFPNIDALIAEEQAHEWIQRIQVPYSDGALLYNAAQVFAAPSRYEGFGLGPLEAMACGTPVIAAQASSLPEVVGDAALCVPPDDGAAWTAALWRMLADAALREELRQRGLRRAAQFSYAHTANMTMDVYRRAMLTHP